MTCALGRAFFHIFFWKKPLVLGSFAAWGRTSYRIFTCLGKSHLSRAASLPGAELFPEIQFGGEEATCPGQLRCPGQDFPPTDIFFWKKPLVPGSFAAWGRTFYQKLYFLNKPLVRGNCTAWGRTCSPSSDFLFEQATCLGQLRCLGQVLPKTFLLNTPLVRGSFAAGGRSLFSKIGLSF